MIIIGIDPGSRLTGYGLIQIQGNQNHFLECGTIKVQGKDQSVRLQQIFQQLKDVVIRYQPKEAAIEQIFMHHNANSALKLGQARGAALVALDMPVMEYSARQVKQSVVGYGAAKKEQVQHMVQRLLNLKQELQADAADALAIALCHAHSRLSLFKEDYIIRPRKKRNSWRNFKP